MKKLNIKKYHNDSIIKVEQFKNTTIKISVKGQIGYCEDLEIRMGEGHNITLAQANDILVAMGLNYELVDEVDWNKVEVGADVTYKEYLMYTHNERGHVSTDKRLITGKAKFHSYVPSLKKVIVICGTEIKAVDEGEVELC